MVFLLQHLVINLLSVISPDSFNEVSHFMGTNGLIQFAMQPVLIVGVVFHLIMGMVLEMQNNGVAFQILDYGVWAPPGWSRVTGHLDFDVKMDFTRKARWVLDGHNTTNLIGSTYARVVSRESVRIALTYAALNNLDLFAADVRTAYFKAPSSQKDYIVCGQSLV